jgi:hypothetical protein
MSNRLEQFIRDHRDEFDDEEPAAKVWDDIRLQAEPGSKKSSDQSADTRSKIIRISGIRWMAAAAIVAVVVGSIWYFQHSDNQTAQPGIAATNPSAAAQNPSKDTTSGATAQTGDTTQQPTDSPRMSGGKELLATTAPKDTKDSREQNAATEADANINEEMYHYARLVEIKHQELKAIEKDEPLLYRQFSADVHSLDSVYLTLQKQLPSNPNREQLLEAMLQNLQLQMGLLNHQLDIIKQINHSKKTAYDKAYKTL